MKPPTIGSEDDCLLVRLSKRQLLTFSSFLNYHTRQSTDTDACGVKLVELLIF